MQISFLTCYNYSDTGRQQVQYELLKFWQNAIISSQIDFIYKAKVEFNEYSFSDLQYCLSFFSITPEEMLVLKRYTADMNSIAEQAIDALMNDDEWEIEEE